MYLVEPEATARSMDANADMERAVSYKPFLGVFYPLNRWGELLLVATLVSYGCRVWLLGFARPVGDDK